MVQSSAWLDRGDWIPSNVTQEDLENLTAVGLLAEGSWRLAKGELDPVPREGEPILLTTYVDRGLSLPPHPFFRGFLNFFGA